MSASSLLAAHGETFSSRLWRRALHGKVLGSIQQKEQKPRVPHFGPDYKRFAPDSGLRIRSVC